MAPIRTRYPEWEMRVGPVVFLKNPGDIVPIEPAERETMNRQIDWMKANPGVNFTIEGHCSEDEGDRVECLNLGSERAKFMADHYVFNGIDRSRLSTISYGKERPSGRVRDHLDRRVEIWPPFV